MKKNILRINKILYYGWVIVLISGLAFFMSSPGQTYSISVFVKKYSEEFNLSSTVLSTAYSIATTISGLLLIVMGKLIDKRGSKIMMIIAGVMLALATLFSSFVSSISMIFISFFFLRYFGQGSLTLLPNTLVPNWFEKNRALALSLAAIGGLLGTLLVPSINLWMIDKIGWADAWRVWSGILLFFFVPIVILFVKNKPEDLGIPMENDESIHNNSSLNDKSLMLNNDYTLKEAFKTRSFWIAGIISMIPSMFSTGITFHFYTLMELKGVNNEQAALTIGLIALPAFIVPLIAKSFIDKQPMRRILFITLAMIIMSMFILIFFVNSLITAIIFIVFYGLATAVQNIALGVLWPNYFGRKNLGSIRGFATVFMVLGSALGPLPFGLAYDNFGNYTVAIIAMIIFSTLSAIMSLFITIPKKEFASI